ncbi:MAG: TetR/AcrR family transcriptional regulator [Bacteroidia bacterium]|nr:TetR/AcrR family transcriptional regulator [Bacteroidia bacterium]
MRTAIIKGARKLVFKHGAKMVTMDEIAAGVGISKKTLYKLFPDKVNLLTTLVTLELKNYQNEIVAIQKQSKSAVDEILQIMNFMHKVLSDINPVLFADLRKYYAAAWQLFADFKSGFVFKMVHTNLKRGINENNYRPDLNIKIITQLRLAEIDLITSGTFYEGAKSNIAKAHFEIMKHFLLGIATLSGYKLICKHF